MVPYQQQLQCWPYVKLVTTSYVHLNWCIFIFLRCLHQHWYGNVSLMKFCSLTKKSSKWQFFHFSVDEDLRKIQMQKLRYFNTFPFLWLCQWTQGSGVICHQFRINSLWLSDASWCHSAWLPAVQVMAVQCQAISSADLLSKGPSWWLISVVCEPGIFNEVSQFEKYHTSRIFCIISSKPQRVVMTDGFIIDSTLMHHISLW